MEQLRRTNYRRRCSRSLGAPWLDSMLGSQHSAFVRFHQQYISRQRMHSNCSADWDRLSLLVGVVVLFLSIRFPGLCSLRSHALPSSFVRVYLFLQEPNAPRRLLHSGLLSQQHHKVKSTIISRKSGGWGSSGRVSASLPGT